MTLTAKVASAAAAKAKSYKLADIEGLYLQVLPSGTKSWRYNFLTGGKQKTQTYGRFPALSLAEARQAHLAFKVAPARAAVPSFKQVAEEWLRIKLPSLSNPKHQLQVGNTLDRFVFPALGTKAVDSIARAEFVAIVRAVEAGGTLETAHRVAGRIRAVMDFAIDVGYIETHAASGLVRVLAPKSIKNPMASIAPEDAPALFSAISTYSEPATRLALQLMAHVFVRVRELSAMRWSELIDDVWVVPPERMKLRKPHVVPLSPQAQAILAKLRAINGESLFVFQSPVKRGVPMSSDTMLQALYNMGYRHKMTVHGFRSLASTVLNSQSPFSPDVIERQLAHKETDAVRAAYNRAEYLDQRRELMRWWSNWIDAQSEARF